MTSFIVITRFNDKHQHMSNIGSRQLINDPHSYDNNMLKSNVRGQQQMNILFQRR